MNRKSASIALMVSSLSNAMLQFLIMVAIARLSGSAATGEYALAQSYMLPAMFLGMLGLRQQALMDLNGEYDGSDFYAVRSFYASLLFLIVAGIVWVCEGWHIAAIALAFAVVKMLDGYTEISIAIMQRASRFKLIALSSGLRMIAGSAAFAIAYALSGHIVFSLLVLAGVLLINTLALEYRRARRLIAFQRTLFTRTAEAKSARRALLTFGIPLSISIVVSNLQLSGVRIMLEQYRNASDLGHFSVIMQLITVGLLVVSSFSTAYLPALRHAFVERRLRAFARILLMLSALIVGCITGGAILSYAIGDWLMVSIFGREFAGLQGLLLAACAASIPFYLCTIIAQAATACRLSYGQILINAVGLLGIIGIGWLSIPATGTYGAFTALGGGLSLQTIVSLALIAHAWRQPSHPLPEESGLDAPL